MIVDISEMGQTGDGVMLLALMAVDRVVQWPRGQQQRHRTSFRACMDSGDGSSSGDGYRPRQQQLPTRAAANEKNGVHYSNTSTYQTQG